MKIGIFSDLHLDFYHPVIAQEIINSIVEQAADVDLLVNAGDLANGDDPIADGARAAFQNGSWRYFEVAGNHDCYDVGFNTDMHSLLLDGVQMVGTTLWTDCHNDPLVEMWFMRHMADAAAIPNFSIAEMKFAHVAAKKYLFETRKPDIVVTHNPPSMLSVGPRFANAGIANKAFIPELGNEIADSNIKLWICGHVHHKHEYMIGNTKIVCNPLGYPSEVNKNPLNYKLHIEEV